MSLSSLGNWVDLGSVIPNHNLWQRTPFLTSLPTNIFAVTATGILGDSIKAYCRIRAVLFAGNEIVYTPSVKYYPDSKQKIIQLPVPDQLLLEEFSIQLEVKKFFSSRWKQLDLVDYGLDFQARNETPVYPTIEGVTFPIDTIDPNFDYLAYVQELWNQ
jgi:hypothetical protein